MDTEDHAETDAGKRHGLRVAWPFFLSHGLFARSIRRTWTKTRRDVTRGDVVSIFAAELQASNEIMARRHAKALRPEAGR